MIELSCTNVDDVGTRVCTERVPKSLFKRGVPVGVCDHWKVVSERGLTHRGFRETVFTAAHSRAYLRLMDGGDAPCG